MRTLLLGISLALAVAFAAPALAVDWDIETFKRHTSTSDWEGYAVGTTFTEKSEQKSPMGTMVTETRKTLVKIEADKFTIKVETKSAMTGKQWKTAQETDKRQKAITFELKDAGAESVKVGEATYACKKVLGTKIEGASREPMTFWVHDTHGVVKFESQSPGGPKVAFSASKLSVEKKVGDATFKCREFSGSVMGGKMTMLIALNSPERTIAVNMSMNQGGMQMTNKKEVTSVTLKKAGAVTGAK